MQKIEEDIRAREKRAEKQMFYSIVAVSVLLMTWGGLIIRDHYGEELQRLFYELAETFIQLNTQVLPYCYFAVVFLVFLLLDHWMRSSYYKRHKGQEDSSN